MLRTQFIKSIIQCRNDKALLQERCAFPQISYILKNNVSTSKSEPNSKEDDINDKPIKFSTSKAATFPAAYTRKRGLPSRHATIVWLSLTIFCLYFGILREENDIDQKMIENIPHELLEQIYGKERSVVKVPYK